MSLAELGGEDLSRSFLSLVELGKSRISLRALAIVAERLTLPMSYFLAEGEAESEAVAELLVEEAFIIFGALAEFERNLIRERTNAGLAAA